MSGVGPSSDVCGCVLGRSPDPALYRDDEERNVPDRRGRSCLPPLVTLLGTNRSDRKRPHRLDPPGEPAQAQDGHLHDHMNWLGYCCDRLSNDLRPEPAPMNGALAPPVVRRTLAHRSKHDRENPALLQTIKANSEDSPGERRQQRGHRHLGVKQSLVGPNIRFPSYLRTRAKLRNRSQIGRKDVTTPFRTVSSRAGLY